MGKIKKNFFIIFLVLVLGVNFAFGQSAYTGEKEYIPYQNKISVSCYEVYIKNFFYFYHNYAYQPPYNKCPQYLTPLSQINSSYIIFDSVEKIGADHYFDKTTIKAFQFQYDNNNPLIKLYPNTEQRASTGEYITQVNKIYFFKTSTSTSFVSSAGEPGLTYYSEYPNDLIASFDVNFTFDYWDYIYPVYHSQENNLVVDLKNFDPFLNVDGSQLSTSNYPKENILVIAEGITNYNHVARQLVYNFLNNTSNRYFEWILISNLSLQLVSPLGFFNPDNFDNHIKFYLFRPDNIATSTQFLIKYQDNHTGQIVYNSGWIPLNLANPPDGSLIDLNLTNYGLDLKTILQNLRSQNKTDLTLYLYLNELTLDNQNITIYNYGTNYLLGGLTPVTYTYQDWYNDIIGSFGLTSATPSPIFQKSAEFIDNTFQSFQSFITIDNDKLNNLKTSVINYLNTFIGYINGFTDALGFLKYLFYGLLVFTMIEFIVKFGRLIIPFK